MIKSIEEGRKEDGKVSGPLLENLKQLSGPPSDEGFIFKQFYLVKKADK